MDLKDLYSNEMLLSIVRRYKSIIDADGIKNTMYIEAHEDLIEALENNETTIESFYNDINTIFTRYSELLNKYKDENITPMKESFLRTNLTLPIDLLLLIFYLNQPEYKEGISLWDFEEQLEPFINALEGE